MTDEWKETPADPYAPVGANGSPYSGYRGAHPSAEQADRAPLVTLWAPDLALTVEPIVFASKDLTIAPGRPSVFAGEGGTRKGWFSMAMLLCAAAETKMLGRFGLRRMRGLYFDYEQTERITRERFQLLAKGQQIDLASLGQGLGYRWKPVPTWAPRTDADGERTRDDLCRHVEGIDIVVVDSVRACSRGVDENSVFASGPLDLATEVSERTGTCFVFLDHAGKPDPAHARSRKHTQRGHSSKLDAGQTLLVFSAVKGEPTLVSCDRAQAVAEAEWPEDFQFTLAAANGGLQLQEIVTPQKLKDAVALLKGRILEAVRKDPTLTSANAVHLRIKGTRSDVLQATKELIDDGKIVLPGGKGSAFRVSA